MNNYLNEYYLKSASIVLEISYGIKYFFLSFYILEITNDVAAISAGLVILNADNKKPLKAIESTLESKPKIYFIKNFKNIQGFSGPVIRKIYFQNFFKMFFKSLFLRGVVIFTFQSE